MNKSETIAIIRSLLSSTNNSYSIYNLNKDFKYETGVDIPLYGYGNLSDFLNSIPDTVKVTGFYPIQQISLVSNKKSAHIVSLVKRQKKNEPKNKFFPKRKLLSQEKDQGTWSTELKESEMVLEKKLLDGSKDRTYPCFFDRFTSLGNQSLTCGSIPAIDIKIHTQVGQYIEVCPCWIFSPYKFYFHLRKFKRQFYNFRKKLQQFYSAHEEIPYVADDEIKVKQSCAVFHKIFSEPTWHRAEVQEISKTSGVIVNFVDYGNSAEISKKNMKYLHQSFLSFPRQAILGFLANIKPLKDQLEWSHESVKRFHDLAFKKDLIGGVVYLNDKDGCIGMALSCTGGHEIHINDSLVKEGYAEFDVNISTCDFAKLLKKQSLYKAALKPTINEDMQNSEYFFTNDSCNNMKLKKMFSVA